MFLGRLFIMRYGSQDHVISPLPPTTHLFFLLVYFQTAILTESIASSHSHVGQDVHILPNKFSNFFQTSMDLVD